jgi:hypothetical protein
MAELSCGGNVAWLAVNLPQIRTKKGTKTTTWSRFSAIFITLGQAPMVAMGGLAADMLDTLLGQKLVESV